MYTTMYKMDFLGGKVPGCQCRRCKRHGFDTRVRKILWKRKWQPLQYSCLENPMKSLVGYSPHGCQESDMTEVS